MTLPDSLLSPSHTLLKLSVHNSTQISARTTAVISALGTIPASTNDDEVKPTLVVLTARSKAANKLISIVEIIKRELGADGVAVYQYNALGSEMMEVARGKADAGTEDGEEEGAFERMGEGEMKKRLVPVMVTYLSRESVRELKQAYGEQKVP